MSRPSTLLQRASDALRTSALGIVTGNLVSLYVAYAQQPSAPFGPVIDAELGFTPSGLALLHKVGDRPTVALSSAALREIRLYKMEVSGAISLFRSLKLSEPQRTVALADIDDDGEMEFVCLSARIPEVTIVKPSGETIAERRLSLDGDARHVAVADITNDGRADLLLFGKGLAGVAMMAGKGKGAFQASSTLFPEISAADVQVLDLNGDRIKDVLLLDWLSNQLVLFFGINGQIFSEQVTLPLPGEPARMAVAPGYRKRNYQVAVTLPEQGQILVYTALASGEFRLEQTLQCPGMPRSILLTDTNNDGFPDLIAGTTSGTVVALGERRGTFGRPTLFGLRAGEDLLQVADFDGDGHPDILLADPEADHLAVLGNTGGRGHFRWPEVYAVGATPGGIALADFNDDGKVDIAVANRGSSSISVLLNRGAGKFDGQQSIPVADGPALLTALAATEGNAHTLLVAHRPNDSISIVHVGADVYRSSSLSIATDQSPYILSASPSGPAGRLSMLVRSSGDAGGSVSLSLFEQISEEQFIERRFRPSIPPRISALTVSPSTATSQREIVFVTGGQPATILLLPMAGPGGTFSIRTPRKLCELADTAVSIRNIITHDINRDGIPDYILVGNATRSSIGILLGKNDTSFAGDVTWYGDLRPKGVDGLRLADANRDGYADLVLLDETQNKILVLYGAAGGRFGPPIPVCDAVGAGAFALGSLVANERIDLILSNPRRGTVSVLRGPFER